MTKPVLLNAGTLTALHPFCVGTRVKDPDAFIPVVLEAVEGHDFSANPQAFIMLPAHAQAMAYPGVGRRTKNELDYIVRSHRGRVDAYLLRFSSGSERVPVDNVAVIVYTREAYLADPDVLANEVEQVRVLASDATHVLVAVLAFAGPKAPVSPYRFVANTAGGNNTYLTMTGDELRALAREVVAYDDEWCVVTDLY